MCRFLPLAVVVFAFATGCAPARSVVGPNPIFVRGNNPEAVWEHVVDVLHAYQFPIARENKVDGVIASGYKVGAGVLEPWHHDSQGADERLESSLQSIRRRVFVTFHPADQGYVVGVEVFKELEDLDGLAANSAGGATFQEHTTLERDLNRVVGQTAPSGWIPLGRDERLEQALLQSLQGGLGPGDFTLFGGD